MATPPISVQKAKQVCPTSNELGILTKLSMGEIWVNLLWLEDLGFWEAWAKPETKNLAQFAVHAATSAFSNNSAATLALEN